MLGQRVQGWQEGEEAERRLTEEVKSSRSAGLAWCEEYDETGRISLRALPY
jgi:hypothetical protein